MIDALEDYEGTVSTTGITITNLRFADDIDGLAGEEEELANLVERLDKASTAYGMEISAEKTKLMTNNTSGINTEIKVNGDLGKNDKDLKKTDKKSQAPPPLHLLMALYHHPTIAITFSTLGVLKLSVR